MARKGQRREEILQALARMLENNTDGRVTTAALAQEVGVSEAALYRHFGSKSQMFEALIEFIEESLFSRVNRIVEAEEDPREQCESILRLWLGFAGKNPGLARLMLGEAIQGESDNLRSRVNQLLERLETQLKHVLKRARLESQLSGDTDALAAANLLVAVVHGRINQYSRSNFKVDPTHQWSAQWAILEGGLFQ
ncbi:MAG: nucleoid occlusion factor SlmA [Thiohalorhabdus sp.]|uniref:nucleoid occlusion factor SlmA n=1 Tax=Thiohalorhabdus sp. TaxID=3094134 RepID=UPI00398103DD